MPVPRATFDALVYALVRIGFDVLDDLPKARRRALVEDAVYESAWRSACARGLTADAVLAMAPHVRVGSLAPYDVVVLTSRTVGTAIEALVRHWRTVTGDLEPIRMRRTQHLTLTVPAVQSNLAMLDALFAIAVVYHLLSEHAARPWTPVEVRLSVASPVAVAAFERFFGCPVRFAQPMDALIVSPVVARMRLRSASAVLQHATAPLVRKASFLDDVRSSVVACMTGGARAADVAARLGLHPRTLQRMVARHGTTYRACRETEIMRRARAMLTNEVAAIADIARRCGYVDSATFTRAFTRAIGEPPATYRTRAKASAEARRK